MSERKRYILQVLGGVMLQIIMIAAAFVLGYYSYRYINLPDGDFRLLKQAYSFLQEYGYDDLPSEPKLEYGMIRGMFQAYDDPYTVFLEPPATELQGDQLAGRFGGIGARVEKSEENIFIIFPFEESPASEAGLQNGDQLLSVDDLTMTPEMSIEDVNAAIRGKVGTRVSMVVRRESTPEPLTINITRKEVGLPSVAYNITHEDASVGLIQVNIIADTTPEEVEKAINDLIDQGAEYFILDLRNNAGGLVDAGVDTARLFLSEGDVLQQQFRGEDVKTFAVQKVGPFADIPLVILVNHGTASAAEIVAGALQAQERAPLIGTLTYGKDSIQLVFDLDDKSSVHVTAAKWWIPGLDRPSDGQGLEPDIMLSDEQANSQEIILKAIEQLTGGD